MNRRIVVLGLAILLVVVIVLVALTLYGPLNSPPVPRP